MTASAARLAKTRVHRSAKPALANAPTAGPILAPYDGTSIRPSSSGSAWEKGTGDERRAALHRPSEELGAWVYGAGEVIAWDPADVPDRPGPGVRSQCSPGRRRPHPRRSLGSAASPSGASGRAPPDADG